MTIDITAIVQALLALIAAIITSVVIPYIKARTNEKQQALMMATLDIAVKAAEQLYGSGAGYEKKAYVLNYLAEHKVTIDDAAIEAKVNELFGK